MYPSSLALALAKVRATVLVTCCARTGRAVTASSGRTSAAASASERARGGRAADRAAGRASRGKPVEIDWVVIGVRQAGGNSGFNAPNLGAPCQLVVLLGVSARDQFHSTDSAR